MPLRDRDPLLEGLWQGSAPYPGEPVAAAGVQVLAICAEEIAASPAYAPARRPFPGVAVLDAGIDDGVLTPPEIALLEALGAHLASRHQRGEEILICCARGWNRSGLASALTLIYRLGWPGPRATAWVQGHRPGALRNPSFVAYLRAR